MKGIFQLKKEKIGIFVTGATGFIGSNLVLELMRTGKYTIYCLVRPKDDPQKRLVKAILASARASGLTKRQMKDLDCIVAVEGDLTRPFLGISDNDMRMLKDAHISSIWHCGASLRSEEKYRTEINEQNIYGTKNTVDVANLLNITDFNYMSTAYVAGKKEGHIEETFYDASFAANNFYEESKRRAENIVITASQEGVFHLRIFRPSIVIGNSITYDSTSNSGFYGFIWALEKYTSWVKAYMPDYLKKNPHVMLYREEGAELNLMPVDLLVQESLALARQKNGKTIEIYHLTNPYPVKIDTAIEAINTFYEGVSLSGTSDIESLRSMDKVFKTKIDFYSHYLMNNKAFERKRPLGDVQGNYHIDEKALQGYTGSFMNDIKEKIRYNTIPATPPVQLEEARQ